MAESANSGAIVVKMVFVADEQSAKAAAMRGQEIARQTMGVGGGGGHSSQVSNPSAMASAATSLLAAGNGQAAAAMVQRGIQSAISPPSPVAASGAIPPGMGVSGLPPRPGSGGGGGGGFFTTPMLGRWAQSSYIGAVFGGWELGTAYQSIQQGETAASLARSPAEAMMRRAQATSAGFSSVFGSSLGLIMDSAFGAGPNAMLRRATIAHALRTEVDDARVDALGRVGDSRVREAMLGRWPHDPLRGLDIERASTSRKFEIEKETLQTQISNLNSQLNETVPDKSKPIKWSAGTAAPGMMPAVTPIEWDTMPAVQGDARRVLENDLANKTANLANLKANHAAALDELTKREKLALENKSAMERLLGSHIGANNLLAEGKPIQAQMSMMAAEAYERWNMESDLLVRNAMQQAAKSDVKLFGELAMQRSSAVAVEAAETDLSGTGHGDQLGDILRMGSRLIDAIDRWVIRVGE